MSGWTAALYNSVLHGNGGLWSITERIKATWRRSTRAVGGYWIGTCEYSGNKDELLEMFLEGLGREIRETSGGLITWQGEIVEMELALDGVKWVRSKIELVNASRVVYSRIGDTMLSDGGAEAGAWVAYNSATVTQSTAWVNAGTYSCSIVTTGVGTLPAGARISGAGYALTIAAATAYEVGVSINVVGGSWRISVNRSDTDASLAAASTKSVTGEQIIKLSIPATNTYAGTVDFRITAEEVGAHSAWTIYGDAAYFRLGTFSAATGWATDLDSIAEFGRREEILLEAAMVKAQADAKALTTITKRAWVKTLPPSEFTLLGADAFSEKDSAQGVMQSYTTGDVGLSKNTLSLTVHGYVHTLRNKYSLTVGTAAANTQVSAVLSECEFVSAGGIAANSVQYQIDSRAPIRHWQILKDIIAIGDVSGNHWIGGVYAGRLFTYEQTDNKIAYRYRNGKFLLPAGGDLEPWFAEPGHLLYMDDAPLGPGQISGVLEDDPRMIYISEVEMGPPTSEYPYGTLTMRHEVGD